MLVQAPPDTKLYVGGKLLKTNSATRGFDTPPLTHGQQYFYDVRAEVVRDGQINSETRRVRVQAGDEVTLSFPDLDSSLATTPVKGNLELVAPPKKEDDGTGSPAKARMIVQVPPDAKLYLDDRLMKSNSAKRVFATPTLARGEQYFYDVRAEVTRDGKTNIATKRVFVRAGDEVTVNFPDLESSPAIAAVQASRRR